MNGLSNVFIGSSSEGQDVAHRLAAGLDHSGLTESTVWTHGVFRQGQHPLAALVDRAKAADFAVMVLSPDDDVESRSSKARAPRDNVVFELGLFMGSLGPERTYMVLPAGVNLKLPTDLSGITYLPYPRRNDRNMAAALNSVVIAIIDEVRSLGPRREPTAPHRQPPSTLAPVRDVDGDLRLLRSNLTPQGWTFKWNEARTTLRVKSPRGTQYTLKMGQPQKMQADFERFIRELRSGGARFDANIRRPHNAG
ncbi:TIR domain-containing protein [Arthrobacter sp. NPDC057009]|uniref:TIR domain-containing protein n=1 Tax=Arthrobacter sp. NPDC057009 TaxID=3345996 RepID=UPI0036403E3B